MYKGLKTRLSAVLVGPDETRVIYRGSDLPDLMRNATYVSVMVRHWIGRWPSPSELKVIDAILIAALDHGFLPALPARMVISRAPENLSGAIATGILAIGSRMGAAAEEVAKTLQEGSDGTGDPIEVAGAILQRHHDARRRTPGLGNPVHKRYDPRTKGVLEAADEQGVSAHYVAVMRAMRQQLSQRIGHDLVINFSGSVGAVISDMGWEWRLGNALIIVGRAGGVIANVIEELHEPTDDFWIEEIAKNDDRIYEGER
jgi:citrate synthase